MVSNSGIVHRQPGEMEASEKTNEKLPLSKSHLPSGSACHGVVSKICDWLVWQLLLVTTPEAFDVSFALLFPVRPICFAFYLGVAVENLKFFCATAVVYVLAFMLRQFYFAASHLCHCLSCLY